MSLCCTGLASWIWTIGEQDPSTLQWQSCQPVPVWAAHSEHAHRHAADRTALALPLCRLSTVCLPVIPRMARGPPPPDAFPSRAGSGIQPRAEGGRERRAGQPPKGSPCPYRLWVILKHLPGLLLAAVLLHALPLQVSLLGLLEDLVRSPLPLPQELGGFRGAQQHGWAAEPARRGGREQDEEQERSRSKDRQR